MIHLSVNIPNKHTHELAPLPANIKPTSGHIFALGVVGLNIS